MDISPITQYKPAVDAYLISCLLSRQKAAINSYEHDLLEKLITFVPSGKTIRGSLVLFSYAMFGTTDTTQAIEVACATELFHSGFLIHDDIMDNDSIRRGKPALHIQYSRKINVADTNTYGMNMGINSGDYCFFLGYQLLSLRPNVFARVAHIFSQEFPRVVAAQMADVSGPFETRTFSEDEIIDVYRYKTARYTFSLPLCAGAKLADASEKSMKILETLGEHIGLLFQIRDDELSAFGDRVRTGKPVGNDRAGRKQTLLHHYMQAEYHDTNLIDISDDEYKMLYEKSKTLDKITTMKTTVSEKINIGIQQLPISARAKKTLWSLAEFVQTREN